MIPDLCQCTLENRTIGATNSGTKDIENCPGLKVMNSCVCVCVSV